MMLKSLLDDIAHYRSQTAGIEKEIAKHTGKINDELITHLKEVKGIGPSGITGTTRRGIFN